MHLLNKVVCIALLMTLGACNEKDEKVTESIRNQSEITAVNQVQAENNNWREQAEKMELDLRTRQRFFQGLKGRYQGSFKTKDGEFNIRLTLTPNLAPYDFSAHRQLRRLEEIISDLGHLSFSVQVIQWNPRNSLSAVSCRVDEVRPDITKGEIIISNSACPNLYLLKISDDESDSYQEARHSEALSRELLSGRAEQVSLLVGEILPSSNAEIYPFQVRR